MYKNINEKITKIEGFALSSPYGDGKSLGQPLGVKSVGFIKIYSDSDKYGLGETYSGVYAPELIQPIALFLEKYFLGRHVGDDLPFEEIKNIPFIGGGGIIQSVISAIEIAIWDLRGKILDKPISHLISNNRRDTSPVYASSGTAAFSPDEIKRDVDDITKLGYSAYKMRVGYQDWNIDVKRVEAAWEALSGNDLMVDAIMGTIRPAWDAEKAINAAKDLSKFNLRWLEEPTHPDKIKDLARVKSCNIIPIAAGEAYTSERDFDSIFHFEAVDILQFDATHSGGINYCMDLAMQAKERGLGSALHVWGSAAAIAANAQIALAQPSIDILEIPMVKLELTDRMWVEKPIIKDGVWHSTNTPGLGVVLDEDLINEYSFKENSGYRI
ncbi:MAG: mandelate racemase/muconate lactonizing enzyme family protein [Methylophilaceae bacterium]|nr:mandelate racemase/muconate lactonizing enzyme family protein [Methylophilaceae bacterium]